MFDTANGTHFATDGLNLLLLEGANSPRLSLFNPTTGRYLPQASAPEGVQDGGDFQFGGSLYYATVGLFVDPVTGAGLGSRLYAYSPLNNGWSSKAPTVVNSQLVGNEALAYDPVGKRLYATIVQIKTAAAGGDPTLLMKLAIYDPATDTWVGATPAAPDQWTGGSEAEYLDGRIYVWRGGFAGGAPNGSDSYLEVYELAASTWSRTPSLSDSGVFPGFRTGGFDVWGVSLSADATHHRLLVKGTESSRSLFVFDTASQTWAVGPTAPYDGGWGASIEYVSGMDSLYQIDGRNSTGTPQGTAVLIQNTNTVRLEITGADASVVRLTAQGAVLGTTYTLLSKTNLNEPHWHQELTFVGAGVTPLAPIPRAGRDTLFFLTSLCGPGNQSPVLDQSSSLSR